MQQNEVNSFYSLQAVYLQAASCHGCRCQSSSLSDMISDCEQSFECVGGLSLNVVKKPEGTYRYPCMWFTVFSLLLATVFSLLATVFSLEDTVIRWQIPLVCNCYRIRYGLYFDTVVIDQSETILKRNGIRFLHHHNIISYKLFTTYRIETNNAIGCWLDGAKTTTTKHQSKSLSSQLQLPS